MKKIIIIKAVLVLGIMVTTNTIAAEWLTDITVKTIEVQPNGNIYILSDKVVSNQGCTGNGSYIQFDTNSPHFKEQYSLVLAAYMGGKKIRVYLNGCGYYAYAQNTMFEF